MCECGIFVVLKRLRLRYDEFVDGDLFVGCGVVVIGGKDGLCCWSFRFIWLILGWMVVELDLILRMSLFVLGGILCVIYELIIE